MDAARFDALSRALVAAGSRRPLLRAIGGAAIALLARRNPDAFAACGQVGALCQHTSDCCQGSRCRHGACHCKKGWKDCNQEGLCHRLATDANHCGTCGQSCQSGCCAGGACRPLCKGSCCADCFAEADSPAGPANPGTEFCCAAASVCNSGTADPADDLCCWPDEVCLDGKCCCDGCLGTKACGGKCCAAASCCNGKCCAAGQVCARPNPKKPRKCVAADRSCSGNDDCFGDEECRGGVCCSGDRRCFALGPGTDPVCCPVGKYCDLDIGQCCANGKRCSTSKKVRIRP